METMNTKINNLFKYKYFPTSLYLYLNYFTLGIGLIALAQNMNYLMGRYQTDAAGIAFIIAGMGIGRLFIYYFMGYLSDRFGRRLTVFIGMICYIIFFFGILISPNIYVAFICAVIAGLGNAASDTGTYPALMEIYPNATGSAVMLCKALISFGQSLYPLLVSFLIVNNHWYGFGFVIPGAIFVLGALLLNFFMFPKQNERTDKTEVVKCSRLVKRKPRLFPDGAAIVMFGTAIYGVFYAFVIWIPKYAAEYAGMGTAESLRTVTYYGAGSFLCVIISAIVLSQLVRPVLLILVFPIIASATVMLIYLHPTPAICNIGSFVIGFTAAGGLLQLGISVLTEIFPGKKARMTSIYMFFGTIANFGTPLVTGIISWHSIKSIMLFDAILSLTTILLGVIIFVRYYQIFQISKNDKRLGEKVCI